jgi:putative phosphoribosyl transferase
MVFASREDAGRKLGLFLENRGVTADLVLGLPRGGVVVAAKVAVTLVLPFDVLIVRKIGHPLQREFAVGAMAEEDIVILDEHLAGESAIARTQLGQVIEEERERLKQYQLRFHLRGPLQLNGQSVLLVDDGLATGATMEAAVLSATEQKAARVTVATPVASVGAVERLKHVAGAVFALWTDPEFEAVGRYYERFAQTTDEEVLALLRAD